MKISRIKNQWWPGVLVLVAASLTGCLDGRPERQALDESAGFALTGVNVIDGRSGESKTGYTVVVRNGRIDSVDFRGVGQPFRSLMGPNTLQATCGNNLIWLRP